MSSVQDIVTSLTALTDKPLSDAERLQLLGAMDKARIALEPPPVAMQKLCFSPINLTAMRIAVGMKLLDAFAADPATAVPLSELISKSSGGENITVRVVRHLTVLGVLEEVSDGKYKANTLGLMCISTAPGSDAIINFYSNMKAHANLVEFLAKRNYQSPSDSHDTPWQFAYKTDKTYFDWLVDHPVENRAFNTCMSINSVYRSQDWFDFYPVADKLKAQADRVNLVDIGGNDGSDIKNFHSKFPSIGNLVLEDLPGAIPDQKALPEGIKVHAYDMFTPQPVKGAKAYYLRTVLHDWPDKEARAALKNIKEVMAEDSILLLNENIMSDASLNLSSMDTVVDFTMMIVFGAHERTEKNWVDLINSAGFRLVKVHRPSVVGAQNIALFEAVPA